MAILRDLNREHNKYKKPRQTKIINGCAVTFSDMVVHRFRIGDVEDPVLYAAQPIWDWQQTEAGKFVMEHAVGKPYWIQHRDHSSYHLLYRIMARLSEQNETFWRLKYVDTKN